MTCLSMGLIVGFLVLTTSSVCAVEKSTEQLSVKERLKVAQEEEFDTQYTQPKDRVTSLDETYRDRYNRLYKQSQALEEKRLLREKERLDNMDDHERAMYDKRQKLRQFLKTPSK